MRIPILVLLASAATYAHSRPIVSADAALASSNPTAGGSGLHRRAPSMYHGMQNENYRRLYRKTYEQLSESQLEIYWECYRATRKRKMKFSDNSPYEFNYRDMYKCALKAISTSVGTEEPEETTTEVASTEDTQHWGGHPDILPEPTYPRRQPPFNAASLDFGRQFQSWFGQALRVPAHYFFKAPAVGRPPLVSRPLGYM